MRGADTLKNYVDNLLLCSRYIGALDMVCDIAYVCKPFVSDLINV